MQDQDDRKIYLSLEDMVNDLADKGHFSKEQKERMYRKWSGIHTDDTVLFDDKGRITGFRPHKAIEKLDLKIMVSDKGDVEIV